MVQSLKYLAHKLGALSLILSTHGLVTGRMFIISVLWNERQGDTWDFLDSQTGVIQRSQSQ